MSYCIGLTLAAIGCLLVFFGTGRGSRRTYIIGYLLIGVGAFLTIIIR